MQAVLSWRTSTEIYNGSKCKALDQIQTRVARLFVRDLVKVKYTFTNESKIHFQQ
jgi:hypothetical protein